MVSPGSAARRSTGSAEMGGRSMAAHAGRSPSHGVRRPPRAAQTRHHRSMKRLTLVGVAMVCSVSACGSSSEELEARAEDLPAVVSVTASEVEGDDALPWHHIPQDVRVVMEGSSTAAEVVEVAEAFKRDVARKNVMVLEIRLEATGHRTVFVGTDLSPAMADRLVAAQADPRLSHYLMHGRDGNYWVEAQFARPARLAEVAALVEEQVVHSGVESISAVYGRPGRARQVAVIWDLQNDNTDVTQARLELALAVDQQIGLKWVAVGGGPSALALFVAPEDVARTVAFVDAHRTELVRRVVVNPKGLPPY